MNTYFAGTSPLPAAPRFFSVTYAARPWSVNAAHNMHHQERSRHAKEWRGAFTILAWEAKIPHLDQVAVTVQSTFKGRQSRDVASEVLAAKAAIDGIVDAGVLLDDTPEHLISLTFLAPVFGAVDNSMTLHIMEVPA